MEDSSNLRPVALDPSPRRRHARLPWWAALCVALVVAATVGGFMHIVYGAEIGLKICAKDGWALEDTFVDTSDYVEQPFISLIPKAKVVRALIACEVLKRPRFLDREGVPRRDSSPASSETEGAATPSTNEAPTPELVRKPLEIIAEDAFHYSQANVDEHCKAQWEERGVLNRRMFRYCASREKEGYNKLLALVKKHSDLEWLGALFPVTWREWTKRGITQYSMVAHALDRQVDSYLDYQYERTQAQFDAEKMDDCVAKWRDHDSPWSMAMYCYRGE